ncbi:hypothetical protein GUJ93_ZPchr0006g43414 [Zizania palustris]|uniref:Uncharacterized protein n=1 Tax=Zizania palustris TaxID=103762 RepID=A0A8J5SUA2_ZIZPA|nr:hypothetical protein GUJ93_ZPchr0006g43414 [Zizania palustris]
MRISKIGSCVSGSKLAEAEVSFLVGSMVVPLFQPTKSSASVRPLTLRAPSARQDFKALHFLEQIVASFGKLLYWNPEDTSLCRIILKVLHAGFHNGNVAEQPNPVQQNIVNPVEDLPQWEQWPNHNNEAQQVAHQQEEVSMEVSGLSVGFTSGSTAASGSNTSGPAAQQNTVTVIPRALSPPILPCPAIRLVYSRRQRNTTSDNLTLDLPASSIQSFFPGFTEKNDKGKRIMLPGLPSIHDFESASRDDQVGMDELMAQAGTSTQLVPVLTKVTEDEENAE